MSLSHLPLHVVALACKHIVVLVKFYPYTRTIFVLTSSLWLILFLENSFWVRPCILYSKAF